MFTNPVLEKIECERAFVVVEQLLQMRSKGCDTINLGIGQPDFTPPAHVIEAAVKALYDGSHGYSPASGIPQLKEAIADFVSRLSGQNLHPERIVVVPGGKVTFYLAIQMFSGSDSQILCSDPCFPPYVQTIRFSGAEIIRYPLRSEKEFAPQADDILQRITPKTSLIIINSPNNPTGGIMIPSECKKLADGLQNFPNTALLSDEIYSRIIFDKQQFCSFIEFPNLHDRLIILDGFSKTYAMTGWRIGWGIWPETLIEDVKKMISIQHSCVNNFAQYGAIAALEGDQRCVTEMTQAFARRSKLLAKKLSAIKNIECVEPAGAFYVFPSIGKTGLNGKDFARKLLDEKYVATLAGDEFGTESADHIRLSCAASEKQIEKALDRINSFVENLP